MNPTTETVATLDTSLTRRRHGRWTCRVGRSQDQRSVGPVAVVVSHEHVEDALKMLLVQMSSQSRHSERGPALDLSADRRTTSGKQEPGASREHR